MNDYSVLLVQLSLTQVYLNARMDTTRSHLTKYWLQLVLVVMAIFSSTSRVLDHRHHVMDVVVGAAIGLVIGVIAALGVAYPDYKEAGIVKLEKELKTKRTSKDRLIISEFGLG